MPRGKIFADWIKALARNTPQGAEVGVGSGNTSKTILELTNAFLYMVDPWKCLDGGLDWPDAVHELRYDRAEENTDQYSDRRQRLRTASKQAVTCFADHTLDFVILDADHRVEKVYEDLMIWWPKIRKHGFLAGRHYMFQDQDRIRGLAEVKRGVDRFAKSMDMLVSRVGTSYKFEK